MIVDRPSMSPPMARPMRAATPSAGGSFAAQLAKGDETIETRALSFQETGLLGLSRAVAPPRMPDRPEPADAPASLPTHDAELGPFAQSVVASQAAAPSRPAVSTAPEKLPEDPPVIRRQSGGRPGVVAEALGRPGERHDAHDLPPMDRECSADRVDRPRHKRSQPPVVLAGGDDDLSILVFDAPSDDPGGADLADQLKATAHRYGYAAARVVMPKSSPGKE